MRKRMLVAIGLLCFPACDLDVPDLNNPGIDDLQKNPTPAKVSAAATGLLIGARETTAEPNGYISILGILGRESYNFDAADPRFITELLEGAQLDPGNGTFGGNFWVLPYRNIRNANVLLGVLNDVALFTEEEKEATRGFAKTIQALDYLRVIVTRDTEGAVIQKSSDPRTVDPIATKDEAYAHIATILDQGKTHLAAGGAAFPFSLSTGFTDFDTPATFLKVNRAIKARVDVYRKDWAQALTSISESFISDDPAMPKLAVGAYNSYSTKTGDRANRLSDPNLFAHPSIRMGAEMTAGGMPDARVVSKLQMVMPRTVNMLTSDQGFAIYPQPDSPVPIIKNEELILLRAEANIGLGNLAPAVTDLNFIRVQSGGLAPRTDLTMANILDELLKQRLYSLLFEGGHRWIDARRYDRLPMLPLDLPAHHVHQFMPIPIQETDARK